MTALPLQRPRLMTVAEFTALDEESEFIVELQEGHLVMSPHAVPDHQACQRELGSRLAEQIPDHLEVLPDVDVDLELVEPGRPGFVRVPDLVVTYRTARQRVRREGGLIRAREVVLAVEILSPGSLRTDRIIKHSEYADAGIGHYWIVGLEADEQGRPSLVACHLAGELGYADAPPVTGTFTTTAPFAVQLDLDQLV
jgi:Uma2 family endonuclease